VTALDAKVLRRFVELAGDRLEGDWVVIGGCVPHLLGLGVRTTLDIDVAGPPGSGPDQALALMEIAEELGLPVEAINLTGGFFLSKIEGWQQHVRVVHTGRSARVLVPDTTLFLLLKMARLTEADLDDCLLMVQWAREQGEPLDVARITAAAKGHAHKDSDAYRQRLQRLMGAIALT
jgi:hypothetical protein